MLTDTEWTQRLAREKAAREKSLAAALDTDAATCLCGVMSDLSERCYCAGWIDGLEFHLWSVVSGAAPRGPYGQDAITEDDVTELRDLHTRCGGWWRWDDDHAELFVPTADWIAIVEADAIVARSIILGTA